MSEQLGHVYRSGEKVTIAGRYEIVGLRLASNPVQARLYFFRVGELLPNYDGWAASWHLVEVVQQDEHHPSLTTPWQDIEH